MVNASFGLVGRLALLGLADGMGDWRVVAMGERFLVCQESVDLLLCADCHF